MIMTVLLVLFTLVLFLAADHFVERSRARRAVEGMSAAIPSFLRLPNDVALATNHTWVRSDAKGIMTVGLDGFLGTMLGAIESIVLPKEGAAVAPAQSTIALRQGRKTLELATPVAGKVVEVNRDLIRNPSLARLDPYGKGWLVRVRTQGNAPVQMFKGARALEWLRAQGTMVREFLGGRMAGVQLATMQDGGAPVEGALQQCDEKTWAEFQKAFASLHPLH
jgi:glycine cleavage system H protein